MSNVFHIGSSSGVTKQLDGSSLPLFFSKFHSSKEKKDTDNSKISDSNMLEFADSTPVKKNHSNLFSELSFSGLLTISVLSIAILVATFTFGLVAGRSTLPLPRAFELENLISDSDSDDESQPSKDKILPKEELTFMTSLKNENDIDILSTVQNKNSDTSVTNSTETDSSQKTGLQDKKIEVESPASYEFLLRVAVFKNREQAQELCTALSKQNCSAKPVSYKAGNKNLWSVQVLFRGSDANFAGFTSFLKKNGMADYILLSKKVAAKKSEKSKKQPDKVIPKKTEKITPKKTEKATPQKDKNNNSSQQKNSTKNKAKKANTKPSKKN